MQCPNCGQEVREGVSFCESCGTPVSSEPAPKKKKGWVLPVILGVVLIAAVAVFLLWFMGDSRAYSRAQALYDNGQYTEAEAAFRSLGDYEDSAEKVTECRYQQAKAVLEQGDYEQAEALFTELGDYEDSAEQVKECRYQNATAALAAGDYVKASSLFESLGSYKDSEDQVKECIYRQAKAAYDKGDYAEAAEMFDQVGDYKDSKDLANKAEIALLKGTWEGKINLLEFSGKTDSDIAAYMKDVNLEMTLKLADDGSFELKFDGSKMADAAKAGMRQYIVDTLKKEGITEAQFKAYFGMTIDQYVEVSMRDLDLNSLNRTITGTYSASDGKVVLTVESSGKQLNGTWSGDSMTIDADSLGTLKFTRK